MTILPTGNKGLFEPREFSRDNRLYCLPSFLKHSTNQKHKHRSSFTLLEIIVTVLILSSGIVFVYKGFFKVLSVFSYANNYIYVQMWSEDKLRNISGEFKRYKTPFVPEPSGNFKESNKIFSWRVSYSLLESTDVSNLYVLTLRVNWEEGIRNIKLVRSTYVYYRIK